MKGFVLCIVSGGRKKNKLAVVYIKAHFLCITTQRQGTVFERKISRDVTRGITCIRVALTDHHVIMPHCFISCIFCEWDVKWVKCIPCASCRVWESMWTHVRACRVTCIPQVPCLAWATHQTILFIMSWLWLQKWVNVTFEIPLHKYIFVLFILKYVKRKL